MANKKQTIKRIRISYNESLCNKRYKTAYKNRRKDLMSALDKSKGQDDEHHAGSKVNNLASLQIKLQKALYRAVSKNVIKRNKASRLQSRAARLLNRAS